ncbi:hypothetical protein C8Q77DRAFT_1162229 [Trametes polyzona]|nr:hypothetical protein C8Q77DRAFT_1162229 [Trametes polyzona]
MANEPNPVSSSLETSPATALGPPHSSLFSITIFVVFGLFAGVVVLVLVMYAWRRHRRPHQHISLASSAASGTGTNIATASAAAASEAEAAKPAADHRTSSGFGSDDAVYSPPDISSTTTSVITLAPRRSITKETFPRPPD